jgi:glycosidase
MKNSILSLFGLIFFIALNKPVYGQTVPESQQLLPSGIQLSQYKVRTAAPIVVKTPRLFPSSWWVGMKHNQVEVIIHDNLIAEAKIQINYPGVSIVKIEKETNPNYLFVTIKIAPTAKIGSFNLVATTGKNAKRYSFELLGKKSIRSQEEYVNASDLIYLIMPDRFANGDYSNDIIPSMNQKEIDRTKMFFRHGGDLKGIVNNLDYLKHLGVTTLWLNPIFENDQPYASYHGYAITDHYNIDRRLGDNKQFRFLCDTMKSLKMKMVMDIVHNHFGDQHDFILDLPSESWIHNWPTFTRSNYRDQVWYDPYSSDYDQSLMKNGWFDFHMPDINQQNKHVERFFIQNHIWWIEYAKISGYRLDTYAYCDQVFMSNWAKAILDEYPNFCLFSETWVHGPAAQAWFSQGKKNLKSFNSNMPALTDFQSYFSIIEALQKPQGWVEGAARLYTNTAQDYLYEKPNEQVIFLDNHDLGRIFSMLNENVEKTKIALTWLMTFRGIPQLYYGTELLYKGFTDPDGKVRQDFEGGWKEDSINKFKVKGRTNLENDFVTFISKLAHFRKNNPHLYLGHLKQFVPTDGLYIYSRTLKNKKVLVVLNFSDKEKTLPNYVYEEELKSFHSFKDIIQENMVSDIQKLRILPHVAMVIDCY